MLYQLNQNPLDSTFLQWAVTHETNTDNLDHYLDDFFFTGEATKNDRKNLMTVFANVLPIAKMLKTVQM
jgi:hypothetical protein